MHRTHEGLTARKASWEGLTGEALSNRIAQEQLTNWSYSVSLIDRISDTCLQGYTDLQSPVKCLDHR